MRILAFSDYRIHSITKLIEFLSDLRPKPDLILYAGDDLSRFTEPPDSKLKIDGVSMVGISLMRTEDDIFYLDSERDRIRSEAAVSYRYTPPEHGDMLEKMDEFSDYGLGIVLGNDDHPLLRTAIDYKRKVFDLHKNPFVVGEFAFLGLEGSPYRREPEGDWIIGGCLGYTCYKEDIYRHNLKIARSKVKGKKIIILSHSPPFGILDYSIHFGPRNIGSKALREFLEEKTDVILNICGHSHLNGGKETEYEGVKVINVASHDDIFSRANIAHISIEREKISVRWYHIPSFIEEILASSLSFDLKEQKISKEGQLYQHEANLMLEVYDSYGEAFLETLPILFQIKLEYGFSWTHMLEMFKLGVRRQEDIAKATIEHIKKRVRPGLSRDLILTRAYNKLLAERKKPKVIESIEELPEFKYPKKIFADLEYQDTETAIYGFNDGVTGKLTQFLIGDEDRVVSYVGKKN